MEILIVLAVNAIMGYGGYNIAKTKNRDASLWAILCGLFGVLPLIILACLPSVSVDKSLEDALKEMKI